MIRGQRANEFGRKHGIEVLSEFFGVRGDQTFMHRGSFTKTATFRSGEDESAEISLSTCIVCLMSH